MADDSVLGRVGTFLILLGVLLIFLFVFSDLAGQVELKYLFYGAGGVFLGFLLRWVSPRPERPSSDRFRILRARKDKKSRRGLFGGHKHQTADDAPEQRQRD
ncbi:MAG: hypothetical protein HPY76_07620 [Anaerolineae bacterium]|nr:hypothetical protein [Anaerolineae bacterium]